MMHPAYPLITVVVPHYNQTSYIQDCLQSVISQSLSAWKLIVVDDASTNGNPDLILSEFHDARCRLIKHERNRGLAAARNTGFKAATTSYVLPLDADDCLAPFFLESTLDLLMKEPEVDCVFTYFQLFGDSQEVWPFEVKSTRDLLENQWIPGPGTLMRRTLWEKIGGYCEAAELRYGNEDWDFWIAAAGLGFRAKCLTKPLYNYRRHGNNMATRLLFHDHITREYIYRRHRALFDRYGAGGAFRAQGYLRAANASWYKGQRLRALRLALRGLALSPSLPGLPKLALLAVLPGPLTEMLKAVKGKFSAKTA